MVKLKWLNPEALPPLLCFMIALCSRETFPLGASVYGHHLWSLSLLSASFSEAVLRVCVGWFDLMACLDSPKCPLLVNELTKSPFNAW